MSKTGKYKFGIPTLLNGAMGEIKSELSMVVCVNRLAKKICRKCYKRLPLNATVCRSCKNSDLRMKKESSGKGIYLDKNSKKRIIDKRKTNK